MTEQGRPAPYLNHFRLDKVLARGGMGEVYLGFDTSLQRAVAIKVIRPELARQTSFLDRFLREARAQAQVSHSNVVQVYFVGEEQGTVFIAMELVDGGSLAETSKKKTGAIDWHDALRHMRGLAEGLREAGRLNIIHRDIKPANILLDRFGLAHIADFGLAAAVFSREADTQPDGLPLTTASLPKLTQVGAVMGSPPYMSPEQAAGEALDVRADIYSLGASFYEVLAGQPPTRAETFHELQAFLKGPPPKTLLQLRPDLPRRFVAIIDRCMQRDASRRFASYDELIAELDRAVPRPVVKASAVPRVLSWLIDVALFAAVTRATLTLFPLAGFLTLAVWVLGGARLLGSTPGQWMMRLSLRQPPDAKAAFGRIALRFALQHGWLAFAALTVGSLYRSQTEALSYVYAAAALVLFAVSMLGSATALSKSRRTAVDLITGTQVLVDVR